MNMKETTVKIVGQQNHKKNVHIIGYKRMIQQIIGKNVQSVEKLKIKEHTLWQQQEIMEMAHIQKHVQSAIIK